MIKGPSWLFNDICDSFLAGEFFSLWMADRMVIDEKGGGGSLLSLESLDKFMFGGSGRSFFQLRFSISLLFPGHMFCFPAKLFIEKFLFDWGDASFLEVFKGVDISRILALVIFQFLLVTTSLASAMVLGTRYLSVWVMDRLVHSFYFLFILPLSISTN